MQSLVGATVVRHVVYARFLDAVNFTGGNPEADPEQEVVSRWVIEQLSELKATTATFVLATPTETDGSVFPARIRRWLMSATGPTVLRSVGMPGRLWRMNLTNPRQTRQKMPAANAVLAASCVITCRASAVFPSINRLS